MSQFLKRKYRKDASLISESKLCECSSNKRNFVTIFFFRTKLQKNHPFFKKKNCYISIAHPLLVSKVHKDELIFSIHSIIILNWNFEGKYYTFKCSSYICTHVHAIIININFDHHNLLYILFLDSVDLWNEYL